MNKLPLIIFWIITVALLAFFSWYPAVHYGGDLVEYYGITESLLNHGSLDLREEDQKNLEIVVNPVNFVDPSYYIKGVDGKRYPVHFFLYSLLALPVRLIIQLFHGDPVNSLRLTNVLLFSATAFIVLKFFLKQTFSRLSFLVLFYLSPLVSFLLWPGPDVFYLCLLLLAAFCFYKQRIVLASILIATASWHSQPILILGLGAAVYIFTRSLEVHKVPENRLQIMLSLPALGSFPVLFLLTVPYIYNYVVFGAFSPWLQLRDTWTLLNGFGLHNASLQKLFEQLFDLNMGLFWYAPVLLLCGLWFIKSQIDKESGQLFTRKTFLVFMVLLLTAFFYQTNPAWHYGTAGFGPSRHVVYLLPFLIFFVAQAISLKAKHVMLLLFVIITQSYVLSFNGFLTPDFIKVLYHSPYAEYVLNNYPEVYNPTPEIFADRSTHTDLKYISSGVYKYNGLCKKAYVLIMEVEKVKKECGFIPLAYQDKLRNPLVEKADYPRIIKTTEATLWADPASCGNALEAPKYICMHIIEDVMKYTGVKDAKRFEQIKPYDGAWKLRWGDPVTLVVPPGYIGDYYSFDGVYVNY